MIFGSSNPAAAISGLSAKILYKLVRLAKDLESIDEIEDHCRMVVNYIERGEKLRDAVPSLKKFRNSQDKSIRIDDPMGFQRKSQILYDTCSLIVNTLETYVTEGYRIIKELKRVKIRLEYLDRLSKIKGHGLLFQAKHVMVSSKIDPLHDDLQSLLSELLNIQQRYRRIIGK